MIMRAGFGSGHGGAHSWQLVLADLALILFLVTLTALVNSASAPEDGEGQDGSALNLQAAPVQALFRPTPRGPTLSEWIADQPNDPRMTLTIVAQHNGDDEALTWDNAQRLAQSVETSKVAVRVVISRGSQTDIYASLAYDAANPNQ